MSFESAGGELENKYIIYIESAHVLQLFDVSRLYTETLLPSVAFAIFFILE
jgi:hypothetical protein